MTMKKVTKMPQVLMKSLAINGMEKGKEDLLLLKVSEREKGRQKLLNKNLNEIYV